FLWTKLCWVHIDAYNQFAARANKPTRMIHQAQMTGMQIAHRWHQPNWYVLECPAVSQRLHGSHGLNYSHASKVGHRVNSGQLQWRKIRCDLVTVSLYTRLSLPPEVERLGLRQLVSARLVGGCVRLAVISLHQTIGQQVSLNFFAADISQHVAIDLDA